MHTSLTKTSHPHPRSPELLPIERRKERLSQRHGPTSGKNPWPVPRKQRVWQLTVVCRYNAERNAPQPVSRLPKSAILFAVSVFCVGVPIQWPPSSATSAVANGANDDLFIQVLGQFSTETSLRNRFVVLGPNYFWSLGWGVRGGQNPGASSTTFAHWYTPFFKLSARANC